MTRPIAVDIDGTLTRPDDPHAIDPRVFDALRGWPEPVVIATGKAFPYPVALCHFAGIEERVIAENGGIAYAADEIRRIADGEGARNVVSAFEAAGGEVGYGEADTANRWRETEVAIHPGADESLVRELAADHGMAVVDSGYAYHVHDPDIDKGRALAVVADILALTPEAFAMIGDSPNDVEAFQAAGTGYAVANAAPEAVAAADVVLEGEHADGFLEALELIRED
jgi:phosphoglycolate phosphatase (TIGR01487 family)